MPLDPTARPLADLVHQSQTVQQATAPSGGRAGQTISLRVGGRPLQARCLVSFGPGPVVAVLTGQGWACLPVAATRQVGVRPVEFRQRRGGVVPVAGDAAVLYSVVVGAVREFWVKTAADDVKVYEIANEKIYAAEASWGNVGNIVAGISADPISASGELFAGTTQGFFVSPTQAGTLTLPPGLSASFSVTVTGTHLQHGVGRILSARPLIAVSDAGIESTTADVSFTGSSTVGTSETRSTTIPRVNSGTKTRIIDVGLYLTISAFSGNQQAGISGTCTTSVNSSPFTGLTPYESWVSADDSTIYVALKYLDEWLIEGDPETELDSYDRLVLATISRSTGDITTAVFSIGDSVPAQESNWRGAINNFRLAENTAETDDNCTNDFLSSNDALLASGELFTIDLSQTIEGQSLQNRLQTSPDTVTATLTNRTATDDGDTCTLGDEQTSTVQVPSPGRGNVEGITYLPP